MSLIYVAATHLSLNSTAVMIGSIAIYSEGPSGYMTRMTTKNWAVFAWKNLDTSNPIKDIN